MLAVDSEGSNSGWQNRGTWAPVDTLPSADSVTPNPASGLNETFALSYSARNNRGYTDLSRVYVRFNGSNAGTDVCKVEYYQPTHGLYLLNDADTAWLGPLTPGTAGTLSNSQCTVNGAGTSASGSNQTLTLKLSVSANAVFVGTKTIYMSVVDSEGSNSGWQNRGTWTPAADSPPSADSVSPNPPSGLNETFALSYSAQNGRGYADLSYAYVKMNTANVNTSACEVAYYAPGHALYLKNDAGTAWQGPLAAGTAGTLSNSQCTVNGAGTSASGSNQTLTLNLSVSATGVFVGAKNIYMAAVDSEGSSSGWKNKGTWTPSP